MKTPHKVEHLTDAEITDVRIDGGLAYITTQYPGGLQAILLVRIPEIEWKDNQ